MIVTKTKQTSYKILWCTIHRHELGQTIVYCLRHYGWLSSSTRIQLYTSWFVCARGLNAVPSVGRCAIRLVCEEVDDVWV